MDCRRGTVDCCALRQLAIPTRKHDHACGFGEEVRPRASKRIRKSARQVDLYMVCTQCLRTLVMNQEKKRWRRYKTRGISCPSPSFRQIYPTGGRLPQNSTIPIDSFLISHSRHHDYHAQNQPARGVRMTGNDMDSSKTVPQGASLKRTGLSDVQRGSILKCMLCVEHLNIPDKYVFISRRIPTTI